MPEILPQNHWKLKDIEICHRKYDKKVKEKLFLFAIVFVAIKITQILSMFMQ